MEKMSQKAEEEFHIELLKYLRGEPNDIRPRNDREHRSQRLQKH